MPNQRGHSAVQCFRLMGERTRLMTLLMLAEAPETLQNIANRLDVAQPNCSHHMALLRLAGLVTVTREGKFNRYELSEAGKAAARAARAIEGTA